MGRGAHGGFGPGFGHGGPFFFGGPFMWGPMWMGLWFGPPWMRGPFFFYFLFLLAYCLGVGIFSSIYYSNCQESCGVVQGRERCHPDCGQQAVSIFSLVYFFSLIFCLCGSAYYCGRDRENPELYATFVEEGQPPVVTSPVYAAAATPGAVPVARPVKD